MKFVIVVAASSSVATLLAGCGSSSSDNPPRNETCGKTGITCTSDQTCTELIKGNADSKFCKPNNWICNPKCKDDEICVNGQCQSSGGFASCTKDSECKADEHCFGGFCFPKINPSPSPITYYTNGTDIKLKKNPNFQKKIQNYKLKMLYRIWILKSYFNNYLIIFLNFHKT